MALDKNKVLKAHKKVGGKIRTAPSVALKSKDDWSTFYTPGVGLISEHLAQYPRDARVMSFKKNSVAVVSDGSAVLGLGNLGPYGALPVMEGKALIFKSVADIDAVPIVLDTHDPDEIVRTVIAIAPAFGAINLEDIAAPQCFDIERRLIKALDIPVMHDDQHGTAVVVLAGLINAAKVTKRDLNTSRVVVNGVGAAGTAVMRLIKKFAPHVRIVALDSQGVIGVGRGDLNADKRALISDRIVFAGGDGDLSSAIQGADIFIGLSKAGVLSGELIKKMNKHPVIFALANPVPEIMPDEAIRAGAAVVATGRGDFDNQVNNALAFPGIFRGLLDSGAKKVTDKMQLAAARALAELIKKPTAKNIMPSVMDSRVVKAVARAVARAV
ncbi:MAG: NADP-dependent malic enzyme [Patescibacteria group bacterium]